VDRAVDYLKTKLPEQFSQSLPRHEMVEFVQDLADYDVETNKKLSDLGAKLFRSGDSVLTHCN
jgi:methylthioribose-1-phosphate isomerase